MESKPISEGIAAVLDFCRNYRSKETISYYEKACSMIKRHYDDCGQTIYNEDIQQMIFNQIRTIINSSPEFHYVKEGLVLRILGMLKDYNEARPFQDKYPRKSRYKNQLHPFYQSFAEDFKESLTVSKNTVATIYSIARDFFYYLQELEITDMNSINHEIIYTFMKEEFQNHQGSAGNVTYVIKRICEFLHQRGYLLVPTDILPFKLPPSRTKVFPAFSKEDMVSILSKPDTETVAGKRDYAVLILASVTGMRAIDIANLKLTDIQWKGMAIHFVQHKTGNGVTLPLDSRAAIAVSDYILHGRPDSDCSNVFLTEEKPYRKLGDRSGAANILNKYVRLSGIEKVSHDGKSFHAFRRSMGAWLLETSTPPEMISQILGHRSRDVLKRYLPLAPSKLRMCALGFEDVPVQSEVYR